jgi:hypothetical protein
MKKKFYPLIVSFLMLSFYSMAQFSVAKEAKPYFGQAGIKKKLSELRQIALQKNFGSKPPDSARVKPMRSYFKRYQNIGYIEKPSRSSGTKKGKLNSYRPDKATLKQPFTSVNSIGSTQKVWSNFLAIDFFENPIGWPPDPNGAVGEHQVVVATNNGIKIFNKPSVTDPPNVTPTGYSRKLAAGELFLSLEEFFSPVLPVKSGIGDPHIRYDRLSKRWFIVAIEINPSQENNLIFLAVSDGDKITDASDFFYYAFNSSLFPYDPQAPYAPFLDYPKLGIDKNSILIGGNQFGWDSLTNVGYVIDKKQLIRGNLVVYPFELGVANFIDGTVGGMYTPQGVYNDDASGKKSFFAGITYFQDGIVVAGIQYDKKRKPLLTTEIILPVMPFNSPRDNSSPGGLTPIDELDTRLLTAAIYKNKLTGKSSLWTSHAIGVDQIGNFIAGTDSDFVRQARTGSRWYEIGNIYSRPTFNQIGTLNDASQVSGRRAVQYFNPSIAASGQGHAILGGSTDAYLQYLNVFVAGRYYKDPPGSLHKPLTPTNTNAIYAPYIDFGNGAHFYIGRWGDYSQTVVDPLDDQTMWTFQEYANVDDSYGVRIVQLKAPPPATPLPIGPLSNKTDALITLEGVSVDNSGFFDPGKDRGGPGYNRLTVKSTRNILVSKLNFVSPTKLIFKLNVKNKPAGNYSLVITNPDGQFVLVNYKIKVDASKKADADKTIAASQKSLLDKVVLNFITTTKASPNPARETTTIQINTPKNNTAKIILLDLTGRQVFEKNYTLLKGSNFVSLPLANLSNGTYIAAIYNSADVLLATEKIIKQ